MFPPLVIPFVYWIEPVDTFVSSLDSPLGYSTGEFRALQMIVRVVFSDLD